MGRTLRVAFAVPLVVACFVARAEASDPDPAARASSSATAAPELHVLFIGNSYTKFNNLPGMVTKIAESRPLGPVIRTSKNLQPGATLRHQWLRGGALESIQHGRYTHVVIQAHSLDPFDRLSELKKYTRMFRHEITRVGAEPVLYETWARRPAHFLYRKKPELGSPDQMTSMLEQTYGELAAENHADLAPVGRAFRLARDRFPSIELYKGDGTHPSEAGSYLAACVFYGVLTGVSPEGAAWVPWPMDALTAAQLQSVAAEVSRVQNAAPAAIDPAKVAGATHAHDAPAVQ
ncbi:MAG: hypothetical protein R3A78_08280 [Polyangiales bacterium]